MSALPAEVRRLVRLEQCWWPGRVGRWRLLSRCGAFAAAPDAILASNSSSYPTSQFVDRVDHPERVLNMHFYMPPRQNAVDIMSDGHTDPAIMEFLKRTLPGYGVHPFKACKESTGFIFNRIWAAIKRESLAVVADGVSTPQDVDRMWQINMGTASGPYRPGPGPARRRARLPVGGALAGTAGTGGRG
ncbi:3-hydroxyacyl-CoA dehydrogenase NAD-binding domain-containing protein [Streptomyces sp. NPDC007346]|uniref:3-hydroxyacyl-CoA dehydrogenase NAD-binding domain-containing protein n=1 Tax=Streptomyces sp. NPDC007346 TaxID=3154682 RepID=UPI003453B401